MDENPQTLIRIQKQVIQCRKLAAEICDPETFQRLRDLADEVERRAREIDAVDQMHLREGGKAYGRQQ